MMTGMKVLVIDDERAMRRLLRVSLEAQGYHVVDAETGGSGLVLAANERPDLILLDLALPDLDGREVLTRIREWSKVPIIILTVRDRDADKVSLLDAGADDYVTKPFSPQELLARIRAALRHAPGGSAEPLVSTGPLEVDFAGRTIRVHGHDVHLTGTEYEILRVLAANLGKVVTQRQLLQKVWGPQSLEQTQYLRVHVAQIRKKIEDDPSRPRLLITEPGVGYRLRDVSP
jgi:two-component system KDP operon response regulator KdpE